MSLKQFVSPSLKRPLKAAWNRFRFRNAVRSLLRGAPPADALLETLAVSWSNEGFSADVDYLAMVCSYAAKADGPILECGSGLSTILLGVFAARRGIRVMSLEHIPEWTVRVNRALAALGLPNRVHQADLRSYGEYDWYDIAPDCPSAIRLVVCDGPPGTTRGGRYGLLPVLNRQFATSCTILMDDASREDERRIMAEWASQYPITVHLDSLPHGELALCTWSK